MNNKCFSMPLFRRDMASSLKSMVFLLALMGMYTGVIIYMYDPSLADMLNDYQQALPSLMNAVGMSGIAQNLLEFIHIYLYGFIMLIFPMIFSILQANLLIVRYVDRGSMACLLATPNSRGKIIRTQMLAMVVSMTMMIGLAVGMGIGFSESMFPGELDIAAYVQMNGALLILHLAVGAIAFLTACVVNESRWYMLIGAGVPTVFFLCHMLANMGGDLEFFRYLSIFSLFPGEKIIAGESGVLVPCLILAGITIAGYAAGNWYFTKKDLSL
jgi:ABC-2 type transport system permease protein